eukprot:scaffold2044_cov247-Pinguiococcus_pyrenoidosus.AAC.11
MRTASLCPHISAAEPRTRLAASLTGSGADSSTSAALAYGSRSLRRRAGKGECFCRYLAERIIACSETSRVFRSLARARTRSPRGMTRRSSRGGRPSAFFAYVNPDCQYLSKYRETARAAQDYAFTERAAQNETLFRNWRVFLEHIHGTHLRDLRRCRSKSRQTTRRSLCCSPGSLSHSHCTAGATAATDQV